MFHGDHPELRRVMDHARVTASTLGHPRTGSEHLLLSLSSVVAPIGAVLNRSGATMTVLEEVVCQAAPRGAGAAADRQTLAPLTIDLDRLLSSANPTVLDRPPAREPLLPFGAVRARRNAARLDPPLGLDAQAAYEASLRLALARRDHDHRPEHLALSLVALDPGVAWALRTARVDAETLLADLASAFPPPRRNLLLRAERRIGQRARSRDLLLRYQRTTGRVAASGAVPTTLIAG